MQKIGDIPNTRADSNGEFTDGNVAGGTPPTILPAEWFNTIQRELMSILNAAEIESDPHVFNQVLLSIQKLVSEGIPDLKDASLTQKGIVQLSSSTNSTSQILAATPKAVSDLGASLLKITNNLSEIKNAGQAAVAQTLANLGLGDTISKAGKAFSQTKVSDVVGENGVPWNAPSGLYSARYESSYTAMIVHFNMGSGSCPAFQLKIHYRNGGVYYRSARDGFGFERDWELVGSDAAPVGTPMPWPAVLPPSGWLKCNGSPFDKSKYPQLASAYPAGYLPDLRGEFIRGWDDGRGVDAGRAFLSYQEPTSIYEHLGDGGNNEIGQLYVSEADSWSPMAPGFLRFGTGAHSSGSRAFTTRPRNIAFNYIVRAA